MPPSHRFTHVIGRRLDFFLFTGMGIAAYAIHERRNPPLQGRTLLELLRYQMEKTLKSIKITTDDEENMVQEAASTFWTRLTSFFRVTRPSARDKLRDAILDAKLTMEDISDIAGIITEEAKEKLRAMSNRVVSGGKETLHAVKDQGEHVAEQVKDTTEKVKEKVEDLYHHAGDMMSETKDTLLSNPPHMHPIPRILLVTSTGATFNYPSAGLFYGSMFILILVLHVLSVLRKRRVTYSHATTIEPTFVRGKPEETPFPEDSGIGFQEEEVESDVDGVIAERLGWSGVLSVAIGFSLLLLLEMFTTWPQTLLHVAYMMLIVGGTTKLAGLNVMERKTWMLELGDAFLLMGALMSAFGGLAVSFSS